MSDIYSIAKSGLKAYQEGLATTGQNIANVGNDAYSRREAAITELKAGATDVLQISDNISFGVKVDGITRAFDQFIEFQLHNAKSNFSFSESQTQIFNRLEKIVRPDSGSVSERMNAFFTAVSKLSQDPSELAGRYEVIDAAKATAHSIRLVAQGIDDLKTVLNENLKADIRDANAYVTQLSTVQKELLGNKNPSGVRNDLLDQRDNLLAKLSEIIEIKVQYKDGGEIEVLAGTEGQGQQIVSGFDTQTFSVSQIGNTNKIFIGKNPSDLGTKVEVTSGKIAGLMSADFSLGQTKAALDALTDKFVTEINEVQMTGVDLDGNIGQRLFTLDATEISKRSELGSEVQLEIFGRLDSYENEALYVEFVAEEDYWQLTDKNANILGQFKGSMSLGDATFNIVGEPAIGDRFEVIFSNRNAENLQVELTEARKLAAASYYLVEPNGQNLGTAGISVDIFSKKDESNLTKLNQVLLGSNNSANPINFRQNGVLGQLENVEKIVGLASLKQQPRLQFGVPLSNLSATTKLSVTVGGNTHSFTLGEHATNIQNYSDLADLLNSGILKTDTQIDGKNLTFFDLGLYSGGNNNTFSISSGHLGNSQNFAELKSGNLANISGLLVPGQFTPSDLQIFTKEGVHLLGTAFDQGQIDNLISADNGFSVDAKYSASYLAADENSSYLGAKLERLTTEGNHTALISSLAKSSEADSNLDVGNMADIPLSRAKMSAPLKIEMATGQTLTFESSQGMMAGHIAAALNEKISDYGLKANAFNQVELYEIPSEVVQFELKGNNAEAVSIEVDLSSNNIQSLVDKINTFAIDTGVSASKSSTNGIVLVKDDGNDINIENVGISNSKSLKIRQLDRYGEVINSPQNNAPSVLSSGKYAVIGGQVEVNSPSQFTLSVSDVELRSQTSAFQNGFVSREYIPDQGLTKYKFKTIVAADGAAVDADGLIASAPSSVYSFKISGENTNKELTAEVKAAQADLLTEKSIASEIAKQLRLSSPKSGFLGNSFDLSSGFPANGSALEFRLGDQTYLATLNGVPSYTVQGDNVEIDGTTFTLNDGLKEIVSAASFTINGPEINRLRVGFTETDSGFKLYAVANDGVISGHALRLSENNPTSQTNAFHIDNTSNAFIQSNEFDTSQSANKVIAQLVVGDTATDITFNNGVISPADASGVQITLETTGTNLGRLKISIPTSISDQDIRLKATDASNGFGVNTAATQIVIAEDGFSLTEYNQTRFETSASVQSLANEYISIEGLSGEDLIIISSGNTRPSLLGEVTSSSHVLNPREIRVTTASDDGRTVELFDEKTGDYLGLRNLNSTNGFLFRDFAWQFDGIANKGDSFLLSTAGNRKDDASNAARISALATRSESTGKGGYSQTYSNLITETGFKSRQAEQQLESTSVIHDVAMDIKSEFSGVDLDTEAARLLEQQQAYQALAKVLSTAKELVDTLLRSF